MAGKHVNKPENKGAGGVSTRTLVSVIMAGLVLTVAAVLFGRADEGVINVAAVINQSNVAARESGETGASANRPVTNTRSNQPNGGLVGTGKPPETRQAQQSKPEAENASSTKSATSTEDTVAPTSTSSDEGATGTQ